MHISIFAILCTVYFVQYLHRQVSPYAQKLWRPDRRPENDLLRHLVLQNGWFKNGTLTFLIGVIHLFFVTQVFPSSTPTLSPIRHF